MATIEAISVTLPSGADHEGGYAFARLIPRLDAKLCRRRPKGRASPEATTNTVFTAVNPHLGTARRLSAV